MNYYKSENPDEQISEAIQNLRNEIAKEYSRRENGNPEYRANREQLRAQIIPTLKVKLNLKNKIFHSSQRKYELSQLARKKDELRQKNEDLISANPRVQLSKTIKDSLAHLSSDGAPVAVFAIEQLLQESDRMSIPTYVDRTHFKAELKRANVGIRKLEKAVAISAKDFQSRSVNMSEQFDTNYNKCIYSDDIVAKSATQFGENSQAVATLREIHGEIVNEMVNAANSQVYILQNDVLEELDKYGINTGLDTGFQTFWKGFKEKTKSLFKKVFHRDENESLPVGADTQELAEDKSAKEPTQKEKFHAELQDFVPVNQESKQPETEQATKEELGNHSIKDFEISDDDKKYASAGSQVGDETR